MWSQFFMGSTNTPPPALPTSLPPTRSQVHETSGEPDSTPFAYLFSRLFKEITGYNPRRNDKIFTGVKEGQAKRKLVWDPTDPFVVEMRRAQHLFLMSKQLPQAKRPVVGDDSFTLDFVLDISWLAGLVGAIEDRGEPRGHRHPQRKFPC